MKKIKMYGIIFGAVLCAALWAETPVGTWVSDNGQMITISTADGSAFEVSYTYGDYYYHSSLYAESQAQNFYNNFVGSNPDRWREET